jgi:hypothetical protein
VGLRLSEEVVDSVDSIAQLRIHFDSAKCKEILSLSSRCTLQAA